MYKFKLNCIKKSKLYQFLIEISLNVDNCWKFTENVQYFKKAKLVKNIKKCWKMLTVGNINKNVEMLKTVDTKIKFFDTNNVLFRWV